MSPCRILIGSLGWIVVLTTDWELGKAIGLLLHCQSGSHGIIPSLMLFSLVVAVCSSALLVKLTKWVSMQGNATTGNGVP